MITLSNDRRTHLYYHPHTNTYTNKIVKHRNNTYHMVFNHT